MNTKIGGKFIVLDGPDGCGKSTQLRLLAEKLQTAGIGVACFRDPGDTAIGEQIRSILLNPEHLAMADVTELLLYMAARAQLWYEKIAPALKAGKCVLLDRWISSTCAYQGQAGKLGTEKIIKIAAHTLPRTWPDLTIILDVDLATAASRINAVRDRMELKGDQYHQQVREGFLALARDRSDFAVINAAEPIGTVHANVIKTIETKLKVTL